MAQIKVYLQEKVFEVDDQAAGPEKVTEGKENDSITLTRVTRTGNYTNIPAHAHLSRIRSIGYSLSSRFGIPNHA